MNKIKTWKYLPKGFKRVMSGTIKEDDIVTLGEGFESANWLIGSDINWTGPNEWKVYRRKSISVSVPVGSLNSTQVALTSFIKEWETYAKSLAESKNFAHLDAISSALRGENARIIGILCHSLKHDVLTK